MTTDRFGKDLGNGVLLSEVTPDVQLDPQKHKGRTGDPKEETLKTPRECTEYCGVVILLPLEPPPSRGHRSSSLSRNLTGFSAPKSPFLQFAAQLLT